MTTKFIGIKEFRKNMSKLSRQKKFCYIVMNHLTPVWKVESVEDNEDLIDELILKKYDKEIRKGLNQMKQGKTYTSAEVKELLGL